MAHFARPTFPTPDQGYNRDNESSFRSQVLRSLDDVKSLIRGGPFVIVTEDPYNAKADGTTDDTVAIQAAIDAVFALGGGTIYFPEGTYMVSHLDVESKVKLLGSGWGSILKQIANSHTVVSSGLTATAGTTTTLTDGLTWTVNAYAGKTVRITSGTGSGQARRIDSNTATVLSIESQHPFTTAPDATSVYQILTTMPFMGLSDGATTEHVVLESFAIDGNKANQLALNEGIYFKQTESGGGGFETNDPTHVMYHIKVRDTAGSGIRVTDSTREILISKAHTIDCGMWGFELRGTDNEYEYLTAEGSGIDGFNAGDQGARFFGCKAFGNRRHGWLVFQPSQTFHGCVAQDNDYDGWLIYNCGINVLDGCVGDRNGVVGSTAVGFALEEVNAGNCAGNILSGCIATNTSGVGDQKYGVRLGVAGGSSVRGNWIEVMCDGHTTGDVTGAGEGNTVVVAGSDRYTAPRYAEITTDKIISRTGEAGEADNSIHFQWGRELAPASGNPAYQWKTSDDAVPGAALVGYDGTNTDVYLNLDATNDEITIGNASTPTLPRVPTFNNSTRPAAGRQGRFIWNSDDGNMNFDNGSDWILPDGTVT